MALDPFLPEHLRGSLGIGQGQLGGLGGLASMGALQQAMASGQGFHATPFAQSLLAGREMKKPSRAESFIEELQAETNEWLGDDWV